MFGTRPFIPGRIPEYQIPLSRYLPPISIGSAGAFVDAELDKGDWILDPFGGSPWIVHEIAKAGYNVLVAAHNPVLQFLIELISDSPSENEFNSALSHLANEAKGD